MISESILYFTGGAGLYGLNPDGPVLNLKRKGGMSSSIHSSESILIRLFAFLSLPVSPNSLSRKTSASTVYSLLYHLNFLQTHIGLLIMKKHSATRNIPSPIDLTMSSCTPDSTDHAAGSRRPCTRYIIELDDAASLAPTSAQESLSPSSWDSTRRDSNRRQRKCNDVSLFRLAVDQP